MTNWTTFIYALLPHPTEQLVLAQTSPTGLTLPFKTQPERIFFGDSEVIKPMLDELTGTPVNLLHYVARHTDEDASKSYLVFLVEPRAQGYSTEGVWESLESVLENSDLPTEIKERLLIWQSVHRSGVIPERRAPWALPGWHAEAEAWVIDQLARLGRDALLNFEPLKTWSISCVFKVITESGDLYFKASRDLPLFVNEGVALTQLAELYPGRVPVPVALAPERGWMLLDDFGMLPDDEVPLDLQVLMMQDYARLQNDSSQKIPALLAAGCKDRRLDVLLSQIDPLLDDELVLQLLNLDEREKVKQNAPRLRALLIELMSLSVPPTILHGDLHAGNVLIKEGSILYFDWTDAAVSHPFFDMVRVFRWEDETERIALQDAYLAIWEQAFPKPDVRRAWELASVLYGFYHAVSYQYIAHGIEDVVVSELNFAYFFLRKLLAGLDQLDNLQR